MGFGRLPLDEQLAGFRAPVTRNPTLVEVLTRAAALALPDWYLVAGCLYHGLGDVFNLVVRPNPVLAPRHVYQAKTTRWRQQWPSLAVLPWPENADDRCDPRDQHP